ncbi:MAG: gliding motility lipoprotein GldD [Bacteroidales bacterium]|nr:gliding motility lipoprotein GldD [Bacteroidales bacterium]
MAFKRQIVSAIMVASLMVSCGEVVQPKPYGYFRITLPEHKYRSIEKEGLPYSFEVADDAEVRKDKSWNAEEGWVNIVYPRLKCEIHVTYKQLGSKELEEDAYEDSHRLAYKHTIMADAIGESYYDDETKKVYATKYEIKGNAATPLQMAITDSLGRFFRGSLYFNCHPNKDSLAPVVSYLEEDIDHIIETFEWKEGK